MSVRRSSMSSWTTCELVLVVLWSSLQLRDLGLERVEAVAERVEVVGGGLRGRFLHGAELGAQVVEVALGGRVLLELEREDDRHGGGSQGQHRGGGEGVGADPDLAVELGEPGAKAVDPLVGLGRVRRDSLLFGGLRPRRGGRGSVAGGRLLGLLGEAWLPRRGRVARTRRRGRGFRRSGGRPCATSPSSGSSTSPASTQAVMPPSRLWASHPASRKACAAIPERLPLRQ